MWLDYFVDHLGLIVWIYLVVISSIDLANDRIVRSLKGVLLGIGIAGILLDSILLAFGFFFRFRDGWIFDILGLVVFPYIIFVGYRDLYDENIRRFQWTKWGLFMCGVCGLAFDLFVLIYNIL